MSQAQWTGDALHLAASPCNSATKGARTSMRVRRLPVDGEWTLISSDGTTSSWTAVNGETPIEIIADGSSFTLTVE